MTDKPRSFTLHDVTQHDSFIRYCYSKKGRQDSPDNPFRSSNWGKTLSRYNGDIEAVNVAVNDIMARLQEKGRAK